MTTVATVIPDNLALKAGEEVQFQALIQADGSFLVTRVIHRQSQDTKKASSMTLREWSRKWAGIAALEPGQTVEDLKREAYQKRFGS